LYASTRSTTVKRRTKLAVVIVVGLMQLVDEGFPIASIPLGEQPSHHHLLPLIQHAVVIFVKFLEQLCCRLGPV